jgi:hypothetical protein
MGGLLINGAQELATGALAPSAGLCADAAMLVHFGMQLALVTAALAGSRARLQKQLRDP